MIISSYKMIIKNPYEFRRFIQKGYYETYLLGILNKSKIFNHELKPIVSQSNSEDDYREIITDKTYEATLLNNEKIINKIINSREFFGNGEFEYWINNEIRDEFLNCLNRKLNKKRIIVFNIYPFIGTKTGGVTDYICQDIWDETIDLINILKPEIIRDKEVIVVSYNRNNSFYIKRVLPNINRLENIKYVNDYLKDEYIFKMM